ncbi:sec-independent protein translocase protein TatB [Isoptericola jiangsuensis]|uniref:Sec-independent protein translocase protein TatB n=1 Tax=Isoptericola jiangsuensis TaxID=548579 RepID=A0A2A9EUS5_9MICO|nr:Sec-independent protein translocase TatB [Isoptericola jiangsuensis]PFG42503.1 sec-independent protein translocase protein TatB [Isoptericola jiangsuensis]
MLGINGGELVVIIVLALVLIGPERMPRYAAQLGALVRQGRGMLQDAKTRVDDELGEDFRDVDWSKLDPRQYDPRRIVKEALLDDEPSARRPSAPSGAPATSAPAGAPPAPVVPDGRPAPFDDEAT